MKIKLLLNITIALGILTRITNAQNLPGFFGIQLSKEPIDSIINQTINLLPTFAQNLSVSNISVTPDLTLYNITCSLTNQTSLTYDLTLDDIANDVNLTIMDGSMECNGRYNYFLSIFGQSQNISDNWNMTVSPFDVYVDLHLDQYLNNATNITFYDTYLPHIRRVNSTIVVRNNSLNIDGQLAETFGSIILPTSEAQQELIQDALNNFTSEMIDSYLNVSNDAIRENIAYVNLTKGLYYVPNITLPTPLVLSEVLQLVFYGNIYQEGKGNATINYPEVNLTFSNISDLELLISPQFIRELFINYIESIPNEDQKFIQDSIKNENVRIDQIIPVIHDPSTFTITNVSNDSIQLELRDYSVKIAGQLINTQFNQNFTLECLLNDSPTQVIIQFYSKVNNYSQVMPQIHVQSVRAPINSTNCQINLEGGGGGVVIQQFTKNIALPKAIAAQQKTINSALPQIIDQKVNNIIATYYKPLNVRILERVNGTLNYTMSQNITVRDDSVIQIDFDVTPTLYVI